MTTVREKLVREKKVLIGKHIDFSMEKSVL